MLDNDLLRWMKTPASQLNELTGADLGRSPSSDLGRSPFSDLGPSPSSDLEHSSFSALEHSPSSDLSMPVVGFTAERKTSETIETRIPPENISTEEAAAVSESKADEEDLPPQSDNAQTSEDVTPKPLLTPEEEAATWKDYKGVLFDELNKESGFGDSNGSEKTIPQPDVDINAETRTETKVIIPPSEPDKLLTQSRSEPAGYEPEPAAADERRLIKRDERDKASDGIPENESVSRSSKNRRIRATALVEEFRRNQKIVMEKAGRMRKKRLTLIGAVLLLLIVMTAASVAFFGSQPQDTADSDTDNRIIVTDNIDENIYSADVEILSSDVSNDVSPDVEIVVSGDEPALSDDIVSPDMSRETAVSPDEYLIISEDNYVINEQNAASRDSVVSDDAVSPDLTETTVQETPKASAAPRRGDLRSSAIAETTVKETKKTVRGAKRTTAPARVTVRSRQSTETVVKNDVSSIKLTGKELPQAAGSRQRRVYTALRNENYFEAVNLSKGNLENNPYDKFSFFSLGLAFYATSNFAGATEAFYACLRFKESEFPNFMVEEFDSAENLKNLFISYPGVDLLIRALELNPENKSLYLNLFLSNLKSEKPRMASDVYKAILDHAKKHGQSESK